MDQTQQSFVEVGVADSFKAGQGSDFPLRRELSQSVRPESRAAGSEGLSVGMRTPSVCMTSLVDIDCSLLNPDCFYGETELDILFHFH